MAPALSLHCYYALAEWLRCVSPLHLEASSRGYGCLLCVPQSWEGENGKTFFFQSELPYDVTPEWCVASVDVRECVNADRASSHAM